MRNDQQITPSKGWNKAPHYKLKKTGLKWLKMLHLICVCCWLGGALALFAINLHQSQASSQAMLNGMNLSAHLVDVWIIIIPGANGCLVTGLIYGLFTNWGFVKHRWIAVKWLLTIPVLKVSWTRVRDRAGKRLTSRIIRATMGELFRSGMAKCLPGRESQS